MATEGFQTDAVALVAQGAVLMRVQNETMSAVAIQRPRDEELALQRALADLERLPPEIAKKMQYAIKYTDHGTGRITMVRGPSIQAAVALMRRYGNALGGAITLKEDATGWELEGYFMDLESTIRIGRPYRGSKLYRPRGSKTAVMLPLERQLQAFQSAVSKAMRNAILEGLPDYFIATYLARARELAGGGKEDAPAQEKARLGAIEAFEKLGITLAQLEAYAEKPQARWTGADVADLRGVWTAIQDGQISVEEAFAVDVDPDGTKAPLQDLKDRMAKNVPPAQPAPTGSPTGVGVTKAGDPPVQGARQPVGGTSSTASAPEAGLSGVSRGTDVDKGRGAQFAPASGPGMEVRKVSELPPETGQPPAGDLAGAVPARPAETPERVKLLSAIVAAETKLALKPKVKNFLREKFLGPNKDDLAGAPDAGLQAFSTELSKLAGLVKP